MSTLLEKLDKFISGSETITATGVRADWDRLRADALTAQERSEIDAIFASQIDT